MIVTVINIDWRNEMSPMHSASVPNTLVAAAADELDDAEDEEEEW